jgi:hypothetical protein
MAVRLCLIHHPHPMTLLQPFKKTAQRRSLLAGALSWLFLIFSDRVIFFLLILSLVISPLGMLSLSDQATPETSRSPTLRGPAKRSCRLDAYEGAP